MVAKIPITILESKKYEEIKQSLIEAHERTKPELLDKLMSTTTITGRPSRNAIDSKTDRYRRVFPNVLPKVFFLC